MVQTAAKQNAKRGDVELIGLEQFRINGKVGNEIEIGDIVARFDDLTPSYFDLFATGRKRPFYMARGRRFKASVGYYGTDFGTYLSKLTTDITFSGVSGGIVTLDAQGACHPGQNLTPVNGGKKVAEYTGTDLQLVCAVMLGAPGQGTGEYINTVVTDGLVRAKWIGGQ